MKKATNETRIRITIKMPVWGEQTITMSAGPLGISSSVYLRRLFSGLSTDFLDAIARDYGEIQIKLLCPLKGARLL